MRLVTLFAASLALDSATAVPTETSIKPFVESDGKTELNPALYTTESFTAEDGETYEIVKQLLQPWIHYKYLPSGSTTALTTPRQNYFTGPSAISGRSTVPAFQRRQQDTDDQKNRWYPNRNPESCSFGNIKGDTGPNAPTTGRCQAIRDWCAQNPGSWEVFPLDGFYDNGAGYYPLISSGKAGTTACHFGVRGGCALTAVGTRDVDEWVKESLSRYKRTYDGVERVRSYGDVTGCKGVRPGTTRWKLDTLQGIQKS
jgi:hypothetical protein